MFVETRQYVAYAMLDLKRLKYLVAVAQHGSMVAAARALHVAQPALSHHIAELERIVGFRLFERLPRGMRLTEGGKLLFDQAVIILEQVAQAERMVRNHLRPGQSQSVLRIGFLPSWSAAYGDEMRRMVKARFSDLSLLIMELRNDEAIRTVAGGEVDMALTLEPGGDAGLAEPVAREQLCIVSAAPLPPSVSVRQLGGYKLVLTTRQHPDREALERLAAQHGVKLDVVLEIDGQKTLVKAVTQGMGTAVMVANGARSEIRAGIVHAAPITEPRFLRSVYLRKAEKTPADLAIEIHEMLGRVARNSTGAVQ